jgi:hypothetical protein
MKLRGTERKYIFSAAEPGTIVSANKRSKK